MTGPDTYAHPEALVETAWLHANLDEPRVRIIDVSLEPSHYDESHIPGAVFWHGLGTILGPDLRTRLDGSFVAELLGGSGIGNDSSVVVYSDHAALGPWVYWYLRTVGHGDVRVLNGGRQKWTSEGRPLTGDVPEVQPVPYVAGEIDDRWRAELDDVREAVDDPGRVLLDVRTEEEWDGELFILAPPEAGERAGHIPGAVHLYYENAMNADGTFRSYGELTELFDSAGVGAGTPVTTYCAVGMRSAHMWFVLSILLGRDEVTSYDGSWNEWGRLSDTAIAE